MNDNVKTILIVIVVAVVAILGYQMLVAPDNRTAGERVGDAIDAFAEGKPGKAIDELEDKTPGEKLGDAIKDFGDEVKEKTDR
ncbi:MAG TPA: hypothetical protein PKW15_03690 [Alphaproteobacteria bacterium]|nr:hypothetical protein [Rhodospirillaceae bacterium]HRJ12329.1 hypothetical protein [Alphaproteobacteria bacterium]